MRQLYVYLILPCQGQAVFTGNKGPVFCMAVQSIQYIEALGAYIGSTLPKEIWREGGTTKGKFCGCAANLAA